MASTYLSGIKRFFRRRFGISAARVGVRSHVQWYWHVLLWSGVILSPVLLYLLGIARVFDAVGVDGVKDAGVVQERVEWLEGELARSVAANRVLEGRLQVELSTIEQLGARLQLLQRENASLRDELALFEGLVGDVPLAGAGDVLKLAKVRVEPAAVDGRYRFGVLLVRHSAQKATRDYIADLQFSLRLRRSGVDVMMTVPGEGNPASSNYRVSVRHFFRAEGEFSVPAGSEFLGGEVRVVQDGVVKLRQPITK